MSPVGILGLKIITCFDLFCKLSSMLDRESWEKNNSQTANKHNRDKNGPKDVIEKEAVKLHELLAAILPV